LLVKAKKKPAFRGLAWYPLFSVRLPTRIQGSAGVVISAGVGAAFLSVVRGFVGISSTITTIHRRRAAGGPDCEKQ